MSRRSKKRMAAFPSGFAVQKKMIYLIKLCAGRTPGRPWYCPPDLQMARYLEGRLEATEKARFEAHLADCDACLSTVGALVRQQRSSEAVVVPPRLLQQAMQGRANAWRLSWKWLLAPAVAAVVMASVVWLRSPERGNFVASLPSAGPEAVTSSTAIPELPAAQPVQKQYVRKLQTPTPSFEVLEPRSGAQVTSDGLRFRWKPIGNVAYYEIRVVDVNGDIAWKGQTPEPAAEFPANVSLRPGKYFFWVSGYLNDGRIVKSGAIPFRLRG
jgi:hypothetical protein